MDVSRGLDYYEQKRVEFTDLGLADAVAELVKQNGATTLYDLGGNVGLYSKRFREHGLDVSCFDGSEGVEEVTGGQVRYLDLAEPFDDIGPAEWVMSLEVGEHLPKEFQDQFMRNLVLHSTSGIILSWAKPGQGGRGHFNELSKCQVVESMTAAQRAVDPSYHVVFDHEATAWLSEHAKFWYLRANLHVFRKLAGPETEATRPLPCP